MIDEREARDRMMREHGDNIRQIVDAAPPLPPEAIELLRRLLLPTAKPTDRS
jgi:hypothetical protein